jgi:hypothetical protein
MAITPTAKKPASERRSGAAWMTARWTKFMALATIVVAGLGVWALLDLPGMQATDATSAKKTQATPVDQSASAGDRNSGNVCSGNAICQVAPAPTAKLRTELPVSAATGCPFPDGSIPERRTVTVCALYWCKGDVFSKDGEIDESQYQIKVRPLLTNYSSESVNISTDRPSRVRLLVVGQDIADRWTPRPGTLTYGDRPIQVQIDGKIYWAISPNRARTETGTGKGTYTGFASNWKGPVMLEGGTNYGRVERLPAGDNLVFQVPLPQSVDLDPTVDVLGLALLDFSNDKSPSVVAIDYATQWPAPQDPASF